MPKGAHWHTSAENVIVYGVSALVFFNLWAIGAAFLARQDNRTVAAIGKGAGALVTFAQS